jgi:hypothetical protein
MVESIKIKIRHQVCFYIINSFSQCLNELVEIFFVKENFVPVIAVIIETFDFR